MKLTKAQRRYLARAADMWVRPTGGPVTAMWRKLHKMGMLEISFDGLMFRLTPAGRAALKGQDDA